MKMAAMNGQLPSQSGGDELLTKQEEQLHRQQEQDDLLLQREREKMEKERLAMNKEPHVIKQQQQQQLDDTSTAETPTTTTVRNQNLSKKLLSVYYDQLIVQDLSDDSSVDVDPLDRKICRSTLSGHELVTDSRGYTCPVSTLNSRTMCCPTTQTQANNNSNNKKQPTTVEKEDNIAAVKQFSCDTCHSKHQCCEVYEHCVSCCLKPENRSQLERLYSKYLSEKKLLYTRIHTVFQFCATRCRTNSNSVINENKYLTNAKHCYGVKDPVDIYS